MPETEKRRTPKFAHQLVEAGLLERVDAASLVRRARAARAAEVAPTALERRPHRLAPSPSKRLGPYVLLGELGRGGMGVVYRALDTRLRRLVALKTISGVPDPEATERFVREARAIARLQHPGIVAVHDAGTLRGVAFVALEIVEGGSLATRLSESGPLAPAAGAELLRALAEAVQAAHDAGIVHRDLKPANVLLDREGRPRLTDFGLARDAKESALTETGVAIGTPQYMAPEQALGREVGPATDVWGLGAVLYEVLTGRAPFLGRGGLAVMKRVIEDDVEPPSRVRARRGLGALSPDLETICLHALAKDPERRYPSARAFAEDLARHLAGEPISARPVGRFEHFWRRARRNPWRAIVAPLVLVAAMGAAAGAVGTANVRARRAIERELSEAMVAHGVGDRATTDACFARAIALDPSRASSYLARLRVERDRRDRVGALADARRALDVDPRCGEALRALASLGTRHGSELVARATRAIELGERTGPAFHARGCGYYYGSDYARALVDLETAVALEPGLAELWSLLCVLRASLHDWKGALAAAEKAVKLAPGDASPRAARADVRLHFRDLDGALADLDAALRADPHDLIALTARSNVRLRQSDIAGAFADAETAVSLYPFQAHSWRSRAQAHLVAGDRQASLADYTRAHELDPTNAVTLAERAGVLRGLGERERWRADLDAALLLHPEDPSVRFERGVWRLTEGDLDGSFADFDAAINAIGSPLAYEGRGDVHAKRGDFAAAIRDFDSALEIAPGLIDAWNNRARMKQRLGDVKGAIADYEEFLRRAPEHLEWRKTVEGRLAELRSKM